MTPEESYQEAIEACRLRNSRRAYDKMLKQGKAVWWELNGKKGSYYRRFIGEAKFDEMMNDFRGFADENISY